MKNIHELLEVAMERKASDLIIKAGAPPSLRVDGLMTSASNEPLTAACTREIVYSILHSASRDRLLQFLDEETSSGQEEEDAEQSMKRLQSRQELDVVFTIPKIARVRANLFLQRGCFGAALRLIPLRPHSLERLGLPAVLKEMAAQPQGLIIITGPTGSGKTTTMAAVIEEINTTRPCNIFSIEEPIEYIFEDKKSVIHQREVGKDTESFASALHSVTRQTPDVICIGEMRDAETMDVAMTASEIGHLVITTLHTTSAAATIDRIINTFPQHQQSQVSTQLAASLLCVTSQRLVHRTNQPGRIPVVEVMTNSPMIRKQIEEWRREELYQSIREGQHYGMITMNQALEKLFSSKKITYEEAIQFAGNPTELKQILRHA